VVIPTLVVSGLLVGGFVHDRESVAGSFALVVAAGLLWGVMIGLANASVTTFLGGTVLGSTSWSARRYRLR